MAVPKRKTSKMKKRARKTANLMKDTENNNCPSCGAPIVPHRVCKSCGNYKGKQVVTVSE